MDEGPLQSRSRSGSREVEQAHFVVVEEVRHERPDVDDAKNIASRDERRAEQRLDALLAQDRVQHIGVVDVREHDRALLGGDAAGKAAADGNPHALLDLFLDPPRSAGNQLSALLVEEEDRARVGPQGASHPLDKLLQEVVEAQGRERRVRDGLQLRQSLAVFFSTS